MSYTLKTVYRLMHNITPPPPLLWLAACRQTIKRFFTFQLTVIKLDERENWASISGAFAAWKADLRLRRQDDPLCPRVWIN